MKRGLVIGKFMPIHNGHIALINFAAAQCDELIVSMSFTPHDPINAELRFIWIQQIFQIQPNIIPDVVKPYFVKKVCFYGPESTGKSTLAEKMAKYYHTVFVPEVARELITSNDITIDDIIKIGQTQTNRVKDKASLANKIVFCDT